MQIRRATVPDAPRLHSLIMSLTPMFMLSPTGEGGEEFFASVSVGAMQDYIGAQHFCFWLAEDGPRLLGMVALRDNRHLFNLFIAAGGQRQGLGSRLWQIARDHALAHGNPGEFTVNASANAVGVYERFGFVASGPRVEQHGLAFVPMQLSMARTRSG